MNTRSMPQISVKFSFPVCYLRPTPACPSEPLPSPCAMDHLASQTPTARAAHCHSTHLCARPSCAYSADTHLPLPNFNRTAIELSFDLADDFWRYAHLWTEIFPMLSPGIGASSLHRATHRACIEPASNLHRAWL
jgi:hypothetical protein